MQEITGCSSVEIHALTGLLLPGPGTVPLPWAILRPDAEVRRRHPANAGPSDFSNTRPWFVRGPGQGRAPNPRSAAWQPGLWGFGALGAATLFLRRRTRPCPARSCSGACGSCALQKPSPVKETVQDQGVKRASKPCKLLVQ